MGFFNTTKTVFNRYKKETKGNMAFGWALSITAIMTMTGAAFDIHQYSKAKSMAQLAADNMALAASVAVDFGNDDRYVEFQKYSYADIGGPSEDFTKSIEGYVEYDVDEDGDGKGDLLARSHISGVFKPAFFPIIGKTEMAFSAVSDVAYAQREGSPASIFFVVDNSGSMGNYDDEGAHKLTSLKNSMTAFMTVLNNIKTNGERIYRTALYPYSQDYEGRYWDIDDDGVIPSHVVAPNWGVIANNKITRMYARYGTDSSGALKDAADALALENAIHEAENEEDNPLKFVVFMSDGANNESYECYTGEVWIDGDPEYWWRWRYYWFWRWKEYVYSQPSGSGWTHVPETEGHYEDQEVCGWDYHFDRRSLEQCTRMKDAGVKIYAIAYDVAWDERERAHQFMRDCSSGEQYFKAADDASALDEAFAEIGEAIVKEVIRIKR